MIIQQSDLNNQLSNALGDIFVGRTNQPSNLSIRRGLVAFDVAVQLPTGATIVSATLTIRDVADANGDRTVGLHRVSADWGEGTSFFKVVRASSSHTERRDTALPLL